MSAQSDLQASSLAEHGIIGGRTGTGKSVAAHCLLDGLPATRWRIILDIKRDADSVGRWPNTKPWKFRKQQIVKSASDLARLMAWPDLRDEKPTVIVRPAGWDSLSSRVWDDVTTVIWEYVLRYEHHPRWRSCGLTVSCPETEELCPGNWAPRGVLAIARQGMKIGATGMWEVKRPAGVWPGLMNSCLWALAFHLPFPEDRKRLAERLQHPEALELAPDAAERRGSPPKVADHCAWFLQGAVRGPEGARLIHMEDPKL